jgi:hypothetical protein
VTQPTNEVEKKKRGRPRKNTRAADALLSLATELPDIRGMTTTPATVPFAQRLLQGIRTEFHSTPEFENVLSHIVQEQIRKDVRTDELKDVKRKLDELSSVTKDDEAMTQKVMDEVARISDLAKQMKPEEVTKLAKRVATQEERIKALEARFSSLETRMNNE